MQGLELMVQVQDHIAFEPRRAGRENRYDTDRGLTVRDDGSTDVRIDIRHDERARYSRLQAARHGDRRAFADLFAEVRGPLSRRALRQLTSEGRNATPADVDRLVERVYRAAFNEMPEKPDDWSTYGWLSWLVDREIATGEPAPATRR